MIDMFKKLFKKNAKSNTEHIKEVAVPCVCEGNNEHCDLVLKLREKQALRKEIEEKINIFNKNDSELINFFKFLKALENKGFAMEKGLYGWDVYGCYNQKHMSILKYVIDECSSADIFRITEELKSYKTNTYVIAEMKRTLKVTKDDIEEIKSKLGIE